MIQLSSIAFAFALAGCASVSVPPSLPTLEGALQKPEKASVYRMNLHRIMDSEGTGMVAGTYLVPQGWTASDKLTWLLDDFLTPVVNVSTVTSGDGKIVLRRMSGLSVNYSHTPVGDTGERPPRSVCALLKTAMQKDHPGINLQEVSRVDGPVERGSLASLSTYSYNGTLQLRYKESGVTYLIKSYARIDGFETRPVATALGGTTSNGWWIISQSMMASAPEEAMPQAMKQMAIILASARVDPAFYNIVLQVQDQIRANFYARQRAIARLSEMIARTSSEMSDERLKQYETAAARSDRENENFDDYIRGVEKYKDGDSLVKLPSGYPAAWSDGNGGYIVSENRLYDPNVESNGNWHPIERTD